MYQRAGIIDEMPCKITGILSVGNIIPERIIVGVISPIPEINIAATCDLTKLEINNPKSSATKINKSETATIMVKLPAMGTFKTNTESVNIVAKLPIEITK